MKKLLLIRHAKAINEMKLNDFERSLKHSGLQDAATMAERIKNQFMAPQILYTSPALRTETTANIFTEHLSLPKPILDKKIYEASQKTLLNIINEFPDKYDFIGLVGHNPGIEQILYYLTGQVEEVPTCAVALISFDFDDWKLISHNTGRMIWYSQPKLLH